MFIVKHAQRFKGPLQRKFCPLSTKTEFKCQTIKVNLQSEISAGDELSG
jgi:hypothetical protein